MQYNSRNISDVIRHFQKQGSVIFLESQKSDHPASTKSYLAAKPHSWIKSWGNEIIVFSEGKEERFLSNPWDALKKYSEQNNDWIFGYLGYDLKNDIEQLESNNSRLTNTPEMYFMVPEILIEISMTGDFTLIKGNIASLIEVDIKAGDFRLEVESQIKEEEYVDKIYKAQRHIAEGDYYEINLSHPLQFSFEGEPLDLYNKMKEQGPVPFAAYLSLDGVSICCSSPERFLSREGQKVWSQPIKGTISKDGKDDEQRIRTELKSEKNKAENLMIVDLVRNDLSRIAKKGTVTVKNLFEIQSFETVHQMVSTVECEVEENSNSLDIIKACFPMGSMTGAPKISAMLSIEELEDYRRGVYSGAIGYLKPNMDFDFNVVIRTAIIEKERLVYPVGGAITSDSNPTEEWEETKIKAKALFNSINNFESE